MAIPPTIEEIWKAQQAPAFRNAVDRHAIVAITDKRGIIVDVNNLLCQISGYSRDELIGSNHRILNSGHHPKSFWIEMWRTVGHGEIWRSDICNRAKNGRLYWVDTTISPLFDEHSGTVIGYCAVRTDITHMKQLNAEHEALLEMINRSQAVVEFLPDGTIIDANENYLFSTKQTLEELRDKNHSEIVDPRLVNEEQYEKFWSILQKGKYFKGNVNCINKQGEPVVWRASYYPMLDSQGNPVKIIKYATDVTEKHHILQSLDESENRFHRAVKGSSDGLWDYCPETNEFWYSDRLKELLKIPQEQWKDVSHVLLSFLNYLHPDDSQEIAETFASYLESELPFDLTCRLVTADGGYRWFQLRGQATLKTDLHPLRLAGSATDIHEQYLTQKELERTQELLEKTGEMARVGGWEIDVPIMKMTWADETFRLFGLKPEPGKEPSLDEMFQKYLSKDSQNLIKGSLERTMETGEPFEIEHPMTTALEQEIWVRGTGIAEFENGECVRLRGMLQNITDAHNAKIEIENAKIAAEAASQAKSEFLANMSHEIRTPMTAVLGYIELLDSKCTPFKHQFEIQEDLDVIQTHANHLMTILNDILDVSKIEAGKLKIEMLETDLLQVVKDVVLLQKENILNKKLELSVEYSTSVPGKITTDPTRLRQILLNLVGNAVKFTKQGGITIHITHSEISSQLHELAFAVSDTGIGMTAKQLATISKFDSFSQADGSTTRNYGGSGLGLKISNTLTNLLGGSLQVQSEFQSGSTFTATIRFEPLDNSSMICPQPWDLNSQPTFLLPEKPLSEKAAVEEENSQPLTGYCILLADDAVENRKLFSYHLLKAGADVVVAENGQQAIQEVQSADEKNNPFDLILMDLQMPVCDGWSTTTQIRDAGFTRPILALTAFAFQPDQKQSCKESGFDDVLLKPINKANLIKACINWTQKSPVPESSSVSSTSRTGTENTRTENTKTSSDIPHNGDASRDIASHDIVASPLLPPE